MHLPRHTPFDGSSRPFTIGLRQVDEAVWLEPGLPDEPDLLALKDQLIAARPAEVFAAEPETVDAQSEALGLVIGHLDRHAPGLWTHDSGRMRSGARTVAVINPGEPPLQAAARLVGEDLVLMRQGPDGWRLAAASLCFPSSWVLAEKFGRPMAEIHAPVPGFGGGSRNDGLIGRMFDNLARDRIVERFNWSLQSDDSHYRPLTEAGREVRAASTEPRFPGDMAASARIRVERQTLRKLPATGDILFTIRIHIDPFAAIAARPDAAALALSLAGQLEAMSAEELAYKGLAADRDRLAAALRAL